MGSIRLLLACSVLIEHCKMYLGLRLFPGNMAVEMFFMISGFYMSLILSGKYDVSTWHGRLDFYASRFWRIWPAFIMTTIAIQIWWVLAYISLGREPTSAGNFRHWINNDFIFNAVELSNVLMIGQDIPSLFHVSQSNGVQLTFGPPETYHGMLWMGAMRNIGQAWSIGTEIWFYLLVPFLGRMATPWLIAIAILSLMLRVSLAMTGHESYFFFPAQIALFMLGMIAQRHFRVTADISAQIAIAGLIMMAIASFAFGSVLDLDQIFKWALYVVFALMIASIFDFSKNFKFDRFIGELSYPIYITHMFLFGILTLIGKRLAIPARGELVLAVTILVSCLLYFGIEKRIGRWRERFARLSHTPDASNSLLDIKRV